MTLGGLSSLNRVISYLPTQELCINEFAVVFSSFFSLQKSLYGPPIVKAMKTQVFQVSY